MRLLTKVRRLERDAAAIAEAEEAASARRRPVGVLWTHEEGKLDAPALDAMQPGEEIVRDFWIESQHEGATQARSRERITRDAGDRGRVYDAAGVEIGRVVEDDGHVVTLDYEAAAAGVDADAKGGAA
jgi:hypothetical protein